MNATQVTTSLLEVINTHSTSKRVPGADVAEHNLVIALVQLVHTPHSLLKELGYIVIASNIGIWVSID